GLARPAGFEDLRNAGQTAGDVLRAAHFARRVGEQRAGRHFLAFADAPVGFFRDVVHFQALAAVIFDNDLRVEVVLVLGDDPALGAGLLIALFAEGFALDDVLEADLAAALGEHGDTVRVPAAEHLADLHLLAFLDKQLGAVRHHVFIENAILRSHDGNLAVAREGDAFALVVGDRGDAGELDGAG